MKVRRLAREDRLALNWKSPETESGPRLSLRGKGIVSHFSIECKRRVRSIALGLSSGTYLTGVGRLLVRAVLCTRYRDPSKLRRSNMLKSNRPSERMRELILQSIEAQAPLAGGQDRRTVPEQGTLPDLDLPGVREGDRHPQEGYRRLRETPRPAVAPSVYDLEN